MSKVPRILISLLLIALLLWTLRGNLTDVVATLRSTNQLLFFGCCLFYGGVFVLLSVRLTQIFLIHNVTLTLKEATYINFVGLFFNNFLPTTLGGDAVKMYYVWQKTREKAKAISGILADRTFGALTLFAIALVSVTWIRVEETAPLRPLIVGILCGSIVCMLLLFSRRISGQIISLMNVLHLTKLGNTAEKIFTVFASFRGQKVRSLCIILLSFVAHLCTITTVYILARGINLDITIVHLLPRIPLIMICGMLPSINGLGVREGAYVLLLGGIVGKEKAFALSILWLAVVMSLSLLGGLIYMLAPRLGTHWSKIEEQME